MRDRFGMISGGVYKCVRLLASHLHETMRHKREQPERESYANGLKTMPTVYRIWMGAHERGVQKITGIIIDTTQTGRAAIVSPRCV